MTQNAVPQYSYAVHKFQLKLGLNDLSVPCASEVLTVQTQGTGFQMWMKVRVLEKPLMTKRKFLVIGTGCPCEELHKGKWIGTVQKGEFVLHAFELVSN